MSPFDGEILLGEIGATIEIRQGIRSAFGQSTSSSCLKYTVCTGLALALLFPSTIPVPAAAQEPSQTPIGSKLQVTVEQEYTSKGINGEGGGRQFLRVTGEVEVVVPKNDSIVLFEDEDLVLRGLGQGTFEAEREPDWRCDGGSVSGTYNAWLRGGISKGREDFGENKDELNVTIEAYPAPPGLGDASMIDDFEDLGEPGTSKGYEQIEPVNCKDRSNPELSVQEGVIGRPMMIGGSFGGIKPNPDGVIEFEESFSGPYDGSRMKITISPPGIEYRIYGTVMDGDGNPMSETKVVIADIETISNGQIPLQKLSQSRPDFEDKTKASEDGKAEYEFKIERSGELLPQILVVSSLWYDGDGEFAVVNGKETDGRYIPFYQALCVSNEADNDCTPWKKTEKGFEVEINFVYGKKNHFTEAVMESEDWEKGSAISTDTLMTEASQVYRYSYDGMKYFESLGEIGATLNPLLIQVKRQLPSCPENGAYFSSKPLSFGGLGHHLEQGSATGGGIFFCDKDSRIDFPDVPVNGEWHELGHYFQFSMYNPYDNKPAKSHAGYANDSTNNSLMEGFAEFIAMLIAEHKGHSQPYKYPVGTATKNLELDWKVWYDAVEINYNPDGKISFVTNYTNGHAEEWAIAGLLWDLHDRGKEINYGHCITGCEITNETGTFVKVSKVYPESVDDVSLDAKEILQVIATNKPKTLAELYAAFVGATVSQRDLDMIFLNHGAFADVVNRNLIHDSLEEKISETGDTGRMIRQKALPTLPGSYIQSNGNALFNVTFVHTEQYTQYDFSYLLNMSDGQPTYFEMPPSYYPSKAVIDQVSSDGKTLIASNVITIDSNQYWNYIRSSPQASGIFQVIQASATPQSPTGGASSTPAPQPEAQVNPSGCLIATAAFGSELAPQVQFLREFRDNRIHSTMAGSSFMKVFNTWYYSFSPSVAEYERGQPWMQQSVRVAIQPLLAILGLSEKASSVIPGEYGSIAAGAISSSLIGAVYGSPIAFLSGRIRKFTLDYRAAGATVCIALSSVLISLGVANNLALMITTSILVLSILSIAAILSSNMLERIIAKGKKRFRNRFC